MARKEPEPKAHRRKRYRAVAFAQFWREYRLLQPDADDSEIFAWWAQHQKARHAWRVATVELMNNGVIQ